MPSQGPSRKRPTRSSLATEVVSCPVPKEAQLCISPPNLRSFPSYCKCANCPPSLLWIHTPPPCGCPGAGLWHVPGSSHCSQPCPGSLGGGQGRVFAPWLPPCKVTLGWLCPWTKGNCCCPELVTPPVPCLFRPGVVTPSDCAPGHCTILHPFFVNASL